MLDLKAYNLLVVGKERSWYMFMRYACNDVGVWYNGVRGMNYVDKVDILPVPPATAILTILERPFASFSSVDQILCTCIGFSMSPSLVS